MTTTAVPAGAPLQRAGRGVAVAALPIAFAVGLAVCLTRIGERPEVLATADWTPGGLRAVLAGWGVPIGWYVGYWALLELAIVAVTAAAAYVILRGPVSPFRGYLAAVLLLHATAGGAVLPVLAAFHPWLEPVGGLLQGIAWFALFPLAYVFPDGRFVPGWTRWLLVAWAALFLVLLLGPPEPPAAPFIVVPLLLLLASGVAAQVYRYAKVSGPVQRRQVRWVVFAVALRFAYMVVILLTPLGPLMGEASPRGLATDLTLTTVSYAISALLPVTIAIAVVRHRLFDIDVVISRTLVYGTLTAFVAGAYAAVVIGAGALWHDGGVALAVVAAAAVALAVSPLRSWLQRRVNRLVYGQRDDPYAVVSDLSRRLGTAVPPDAVLRTLVDTIGTALKLPYVSVSRSRAGRVGDVREAAFAGRTGRGVPGGVPRRADRHAAGRAGGGRPAGADRSGAAGRRGAAGGRRRAGGVVAERGARGPGTRGRRARGGTPAAAPRPARRARADAGEPVPAGGRVGRAALP